MSWYRRHKNSLAWLCSRVHAIQDKNVDFLIDHKDLEGGGQKNTQLFINFQPHDLRRADTQTPTR